MGWDSGTEVTEPVGDGGAGTTDAVVAELEIVTAFPALLPPGLVVARAVCTGL